MKSKSMAADAFASAFTFLCLAGTLILSLSNSAHAVEFPVIPEGNVVASASACFGLPCQGIDETASQLGVPLSSFGINYPVVGNQGGGPYVTSYSTTPGTVSAPGSGGSYAFVSVGTATTPLLTATSTTPGWNTFGELRYFFAIQNPSAPSTVAPVAANVIGKLGVFATTTDFKGPANNTVANSANASAQISIAPMLNGFSQPAIFADALQVKYSFDHGSDPMGINFSSSAVTVNLGPTSTAQGILLFDAELSLETNTLYRVDLVTNLTGGIGLPYSESAFADPFISLPDGYDLFLSAGINNIPETPLPAALPLFATGLGALGLLGWRRKRKALAA